VYCCPVIGTNHPQAHLFHATLAGIEPRYALQSRTLPPRTPNTCGY
jgi:hypothetical protein